MINGTGNIYQMTMWLDAGNKYRGSVNYFTKKKGEILISINEWLAYYNVRINKLKFNAGTEVLIKVKPLKHTTSANFRELSIEKRQCRFKDENEVNKYIHTLYVCSSTVTSLFLPFQNNQTLFKFYRQKGCQFECRLRYAANFTNCIPWDYPVPEDLDGIDICLSEREGKNMLKEFGGKMDDPVALEKCDCLPDCEEIKYETQES